MANKAARVVEYNGVQHSFPGDATDDEISQALGAAYQQDALREKMASPTQFELDRNYNNDRPGVVASAGNTLMSLIRGIPDSVRGMFDPATNARRGADLFNADQDRADKGRSLAYRASAALTSPVADVSGMEEEAEHANPEGVIGHAAGSAAPYLLPGVAEGGLKGAGAVLEHPLTAKVMPKAARLSGAMMGYAAGHGMGHPYLGMGAGAGVGEVAGEVLADKVKSAGASMRDAGNSIGDFMKPPQPARPPRIPLWKQAGVEAGKPAPNVQITNIPEPTPRLKSVSGGSGPVPAPAPNAPDMPLMPPHENYGFMPPDHPATVSGEAWSKMSQSALTQHFGGRPVLVTDAEPNAIWDTGKGEVILYRKPSPMDRAKMFPQAFNKSAGGR